MYCALCRFSMNLKCRKHTCTFVSDSLISSLIRAGLHPHPRNFKEFAVETFTLYQAWTHHIRWEWECVYHFLYILPCEYLEFLHRASLSMQSLHPEVRENIQRRQPDIWCMSVCYLVPFWPGFFGNTNIIFAHHLDHLSDLAVCNFDYIPKIKIKVKYWQIGAHLLPIVAAQVQPYKTGVLVRNQK